MKNNVQYKGKICIIVLHGNNDLTYYDRTVLNSHEAARGLSVAS